MGGSRRRAGGNKGRTKAVAIHGSGALPEALLSQFDGSIEVCAGDGRAGLRGCWVSRTRKGKGQERQHCTRHASLSGAPELCGVGPIQGLPLLS